MSSTTAQVSPIPDGGRDTPQIFSNLPESWSKVSHAARELATAVYNNSWRMGHPPPQRKVSRHITASKICVEFTHAYIQCCRSKSIARGALLMVRRGYFLVCIFIRNFEVNFAYLHMKMRVYCSRQRSFTTLHLMK